MHYLPFILYDINAKWKCYVKIIFHFSLFTLKTYTLPLLTLLKMTLPSLVKPPFSSHTSHLLSLFQPHFSGSEWELSSKCRREEGRKNSFLPSFLPPFRPILYLFSLFLSYISFLTPFLSSPQDSLGFFVYTFLLFAHSLFKKSF